MYSMNPRDEGKCPNFAAFSPCAELLNGSKITVKEAEAKKVSDVDAELSYGAGGYGGYRADYSTV